GMFLSTLSFLGTTPGAWADEIGGFPAISVLGQFLIKDVALLATAVWSFGEAVRAPGSNPTREPAPRGTPGRLKACRGPAAERVTRHAGRFPTDVGELLWAVIAPGPH